MIWSEIVGKWLPKENFPSYPGKISIVDTREKMEKMVEKFSFPSFSLKENARLRYMNLFYLLICAEDNISTDSSAFP